MKKLYIFAVVGLIVGYGFGSVTSPFKRSADDREGSKGTELDFPDAVEVAVPGVDAEAVARLERERDAALAELDEMRTALDNSRAEVASYVARVEKLKQSDGNSEGKRADWSKRMKERREKWKEENPEEYEAHQKRIADFRERMDGVVAEKSAFLVNLDTSGMTEEEKEDHDELLGRVAEAWELMNGMQEGKWPTREQWSGVRENMTAIRDLYAKERDYVLRQVGSDLGYDKDQSQEFSKYLQDVFEKTSPSLPRSVWRGFGRRQSSNGGGHN